MPPTKPKPATPDELRAWRGRHHVTQDEAARWWGVTTRTWQRYEAGVSAIPAPLAKRLRQEKHPVRVAVVQEYP